jgi:hypothetical protein
VSGVAPPGLPEIVDEATDTPAWVPWLGFALVIATVIFAFLGGKDEPAPAPATAPAAEAPAGAHE